MSEEYHKCDREKGFCPTMAARAEPVGQGARHGLIQMAVMDFSAKPITTRGIGIMYKMNAKDKGIMLNICPWCGERIDYFRQDRITADAEDKEPAHV